MMKHITLEILPWISNEEKGNSRKTSMEVGIKHKQMQMPGIESHERQLRDDEDSRSPYCSRHKVKESFRKTKEV